MLYYSGWMVFFPAFFYTTVGGYWGIKMADLWGSAYGGVILYSTVLSECEYNAGGEL